MCFGVKAVTGLVFTLAGLSTKLTISAEEMRPTLRVTPCARATPDQIKVLGREPGQLDREQSLFMEWSKIPNIVFKTNFPESIISLRRLRSAWEPWGPQEAGYTFGPARIAALTAKGW